jgi:hypothetical protein
MTERMLSVPTATEERRKLGRPNSVTLHVCPLFSFIKLSETRVTIRNRQTGRPAIQAGLLARTRGLHV